MMPLCTISQKAAITRVFIGWSLMSATGSAPLLTAASASIPVDLATVCRPLRRQLAWLVRQCSSGYSSVSRYPCTSVTPTLEAKLITESIITCPVCGTAKTETMPTDACQYFYECTGCGTLLRPKKGDCCVLDGTASPREAYSYRGVGS
jgi:hypothetical protein